MKLLLSPGLAAWLVLAGLGFGASGGNRVTAPLAAHSVRPVPASSGRVLERTLSFPPDTNYCRTQFGYSCYQPAQFQRAYDLGPLLAQGLDGRGQTIVLVDPFGSPTIADDLQYFDRTFGLPDPPRFQVIEPAGPVPAFPSDPFGVSDRSVWAAETTLDVEWSHVMAPGASILLVATPVSETEGVQGFPEIVAAENYVIDRNLGGVISQSFGATEQTFNSPKDILKLRSAFINAQRQRHNVTVLGGSGDQGVTDFLPDSSCCFPMRVNSWPSSDPLVTSVGGTQLHLDAAGKRLAPDNVWNDFAALGAGASGGGQSTVFSRPAFQDHVRKVVGGARGTPDISMSAAIDGAVVMYYSFCDYNRTDPNTGSTPSCGGQWHLAGGTSEASPLFAGIVAIADQAAGHQLGWLNPMLYAHPGQNVSRGIVDVTSGTNTYIFCSADCGTRDEVDTTVPGFDARAGYDLASGLGTIDASRFVTAVARR